MSRDLIEALVPHAGTMCLLDAIVDWSETAIHCRSDGHRAVEHPLRHRGRLHAVHLAEYGAQAMAVHGGLLARASGTSPRPGMLVSLRGLTLAVARIDDLPGTLDVHAELLLAGEASWQYRIRVEHAGRMLADGRAAVMLQSPPTGSSSP